MDSTDQRHIARDSLFVLVDLRLDDQEEIHRIKMRNLSAGGMMGEGPVRVSRGARVSINIRNIGWVDGTIAWVQEDRFGMAFNQDVDPKIARMPMSDGDHTPRYVRPVLPTADPKTLRKV